MTIAIHERAMTVSDQAKSSAGSGVFVVQVLFQGGWLTAALLAAFPCFAWYGHAASGMIGVTAAALAGIVCLVAGWAALFAVGATRGGPNAVSGMLLATGFRLGLPLAVGLIVQTSGSPLASARFFAMLMVYYLVMLLVETPLSLRLVRSGEESWKAS